MNNNEIICKVFNTTTDHLDVFFYEHMLKCIDEGRKEAKLQVYREVFEELENTIPNIECYKRDCKGCNSNPQTLCDQYLKLKKKFLGGKK